MLVNETFARLFLPGIPPLAGRFTRPMRTTEREAERQIPQQVVGLVGDAKYNDLREAAPPIVYLPLRARPDLTDLTDSGGALAIRSTLRNAG